MSEIKNNLQFKDDKLHLEDEVVMKKVSGIPVNQEDETGTIDVDANINIGGSASINGDVTVKGSVTIEGTSYKVIENSEYVWAIMDNDDKILCGIKTDGKFVADIDGIDEKIQEAINQMQTIIDEAQASIDEKIAAIDEKFDFISWIEDPEGRSEITTDSEGKIISYRDSDGVKHEEAGLKTNALETDTLRTNSFHLPEDAMEQVIEEVKEEIGTVTKPKEWYMPMFGTVKVKNETFYLTANEGYSDKDGIVCIQMYDDTDENAYNLVTLSYYYVKSTLTPKQDGTYDRTSVNENSIRLDFYAATLVSEVDSKYYVTSSLEGGAVVPTSIEVTQIIDTAPYKAWVVNKDKHRCIADIDFGTFYSKTNVPIELSYQGNSTMQYRKRGFRLTFYKKNDYKKKNKVKIGEWVRLSGYNLKAYPSHDARIKNPVLSNTFLEVWESRGKECYPWNKDNVVYNGATGFIKEFPIKLSFGDEFYGLHFFGYKKDEKNYMLDGDDDSSGIFVSCDVHGDLYDTSANQWADEMGVKGREYAYPSMGDDSVSVETAIAMNELFKYLKGFVDGTIEIDGQVVDFDNSMLEERVDIANLIDYWIGCQVFQLWDNVFHNTILYSGRDKKKFYWFFYDLDTAMNYAYDMDVIDICANPYGSMVIPTVFWQKFIDVYKDSVINRYAELRKSVLSNSNIENIYKSFISGIPENVVELEVGRWGNGNPADFSATFTKITKRLEWLDNTQFNL